MIRIHPGYVKDSEGLSTLSTDIEIDGEKTNVYLSVEPQYGKFLSPERADYALIGLLAYAMRHGHDIICEAPVTEELLYNIREILLPTLVRSDSRSYHTKIQADIAPPLKKLPFAVGKLGAVGTGVSLGVDSAYTILKHFNSVYPNQNLTHLCIFQNGSAVTADPLINEKIFEHAEAVAKEFNLPLLKVESNVKSFVKQKHVASHTYKDVLIMYAMQKLWRVYYYSGGYSFSDFSLKNNLYTATAHFEPFLLDCFSISNLRIVPSGSEGDRDDKINFIIDNPIVQKYLPSVCLSRLTAASALNVGARFWHSTRRINLRITESHSTSTNISSNEKESTSI
ncbi:MAG: hypothetical protein IKO05_03675 [Selenomonadaceae bacterium]|nr:hypothetical protein [Selenomonadaceae bacterium]